MNAIEKAIVNFVATNGTQVDSVDIHHELQVNGYQSEKILSAVDALGDKGILNRKMVGIRAWYVIDFSKLPDTLEDK